MSPTQLARQLHKLNRTLRDHHALHQVRARIAAIWDQSVDVVRSTRRLFILFPTSRRRDRAWLDPVDEYLSSVVPEDRSMYREPEAGWRHECSFRITSPGSSSIPRSHMAAHEIAQRCGQGPRYCIEGHQ